MSETNRDPVVDRIGGAHADGRFPGRLRVDDGAASWARSRSRRRASARALEPEQIDEVVFGCVLPAGLGQAPARQAALGARLPLSTGSTTVNKMCGSGMRAAMFAHDMLLAGSVDVIVAGGMESMTNAPYLLPKARGGMRMGHGQVIDHMFLDGLEDAYEKGRLMGTFAEQCAASYRRSRAKRRTRSRSNRCGVRSARTKTARSSGKSRP